MRKKSVTILDIAREAGVDNSTVSLALRGDPRITDATRQRIQEVATRMNYVRNDLARSLSGGKTRIIGVMLTGMENSFFAPLIEACDEAVAASRRSLVVKFSSWDAEREKRGMRQFCESRVDGMIWAATNTVTPGFGEILTSFRNAGIPLVLLGGSPVECHQVRISDDETVAVGAAYITSLGHQRVGLLGATDQPGWRGTLHQNRIVCMRSVLAEHGMVVRPEDEFHVADNEYGGVAVPRQLLARPVEDRPTLIWAADDMLARGLTSGAMALGLKVPDELSVLGYDDAPGSARGEIPITTVSLQARTQGEEAIRLLLSLVDGKPEREPVQIILKAKVVERRSCAPSS